MAELARSPNIPRPTGLTLEIADMLRRIENNYGREGSGPGSRFEGRLLEDVQAEAVLRRIRELADLRYAVYPADGTCLCVSHRRPFGELLGGDQR